MSAGADGGAGGDDRVIGRAFRASMAVLAAIAVGVAAWRMWPRPAPAPLPAAPLPEGPAQHAASEAGDAVPFEDVGAAWGIDFDRTDGADGRRLLPETMGGGVAAWDVDADGDLDLLFADGDAWPDAPAGSRRGQGIAVYLNQGARPDAPRFVRARGTGLERPWQGMGLALADLDGDGLPELLATGVGGVRFFRAVPGDPSARVRWRDATEEAGLAQVDGWTTAAGFADLDRDGDLDLVVARYVEWSEAIDSAVGYSLTGIGRAYGPPNGFAGTQLLLFEQREPMRFVDVAAERGLHVLAPGTGGPVAKALGILFEDVDSDGDLDVFVANDTVRNFLFVNDGHGAFVERGIQAGIAFDRNGAATGAMGCDASHLRNGDALAVAVGNFANEPCSLFVGTGAGRFDDDAIVEGISAATRRPLAFGVAFVDVDGDGWEDLALANGHIEPRIGEVQDGQRPAQAAQLFRNRGRPSGPAFTQVPPGALGAMATPVVGRGLTWGDLDGDGRADLVIGTVSGRPLVLRNAAGSGGTFAVRLRDLHPGNRAAIGAEVRLQLQDGRVLRRRISPTRSYLSQVPPVAWFGIGSSGPRSVEVFWPDGGRSSTAVAAGSSGRGGVLSVERTAPAEASVRGTFPTR